MYGMPLIANESHGAGTMTGLKPQGEDQPARGEEVRPEICTMLPTALHAMASDFWQHEAADRDRLRSDRRFRREVDARRGWASDGGSGMTHCMRSHAQ